MMNINEFIEATNKCTDENEIFSLFEIILNQYGYDRLCYSLMTAHPSISKPAGHAVLANYPLDFLEHYMEKGYPDLDPVRQYVVTTYQPFLWNELNSLMELDSKNELVMNEAGESGLLDGLAVPIYGPGGEIAGVGMASSQKIGTLSYDKVHEINLICQHFHIAYSMVNRRQRQVANFHPKLSARERDILAWAAQGKSDSVISDILNISEGTVKTYLQRINKKLQTTGRIATISKAILLGLVKM